jgi:hypothetical protein
MTLASHDWLMPGVEPAAWHQNQIKSGALINGPWAVDVKQSGTYEISLHRWPPYLNKSMGITTARLTIGGSDDSQSLEKDATGATFKIKLKAGPTMLHLLRIDHLKLTYKYAGRNFRLSDVHGHLVKKILA